MRITNDLYNTLLKVKSQKKGIVTFLENQGYSTRYATQIRDKFNELEVVPSRSNNNSVGATGALPVMTNWS